MYNPTFCFSCTIRATVRQATAVGALIFDGHMAALREGVDVADVVAAINSDLSTQGFRYVVAKKDNAWRGIEGVSAVAEGRAALVEAAEIRWE